MAQIGSYVYLIDFKDGSEQEVLTKKELQDSVDDIYDNISQIVKQYKLQQNGRKKKINMTLFLETENFSASEYIEHYKSLSKDEYGTNFLSDFDIELINMFN
jgi:cellobiose phosphorylase